jgi:hypothetical protein
MSAEPKDFDHLPKPTLGPVGAHPFLALHGVATKPRGASDFLARRPQRLGNLARDEEAVVGILNQAHQDLHSRNL